MQKYAHYTESLSYTSPSSLPYTIWMDGWMEGIGIPCTFDC